MVINTITSTHKCTDGTTGVNFQRVDSAAEFTLGTRVAGSSNTEWVYCKTSSSAAAANEAVTIDENFELTLLNTTSGDLAGDFGWPQVSLTTGVFGWVALKGQIAIKVLNSCAADADLFFTSTKGVLDDVGTSTSDRITGIHTVTANASASIRRVQAIVSYPTADLA